MSKSYLFALPLARAVLENADSTVPVFISGLRGIEMALASITQGPKLFEIWNLRKRIHDSLFADGRLDARYLVLSAEEKELVLHAVKNFDWTLKGESQFWVNWGAFLDALQEIPEFDEKNPPADYVTWKKEFDAYKAEQEAARKAAEAKALAAKEASEKKRRDGIAKIKDALLAEALQQKIRDGKLGNAATIEDLPDTLVVEIAEQAEAQYKLVEAAEAAIPAEATAAAEAQASQASEPADATENPKEG
jgi:hypothetical protein